MTQRNNIVIRELVFNTQGNANEPIISWKGLTFPSIIARTAHIHSYGLFFGSVQSVFTVIPMALFKCILIGFMFYHFVPKFNNAAIFTSYSRIHLGTHNLKIQFSANTSNLITYFTRGKHQFNARVAFFPMHLKCSKITRRIHIFSSR